jgi:hypothetical protein
VPLRVIMDILWHSHLATTASLYAHVMPTARLEAAKLFDEAMHRQ